MIINLSGFKLTTLNPIDTEVILHINNFHVEVFSFNEFLKTLYSALKANSSLTSVLFFCSLAFKGNKKFYSSYVADFFSDWVKIMLPFKIFITRLKGCKSCRTKTSRLVIMFACICVSELMLAISVQEVSVAF